MDWHREVFSSCIVVTLYWSVQGDVSTDEEETIMRNAMLAILAVLAGGTAVIASAGSAAAYDYPWCVVGGELGASGDCSYSTLAQCQASASGRWNLYCAENKLVLFQRQQGVQPSRRQRRDY